MTADSDLPLPHLLSELVSSGQWPRTGNDVLAQQVRPLVPIARVKAIAPEEDGLVLEAPPFRTLAAEIRVREVAPFWLEEGALDEIDPSLALVIGDFGPGSDAPIILDYRIHRHNPSVLRLQWSVKGNHWVSIDDSFDQFVGRLGLVGS